jgi:hypothetical protein
LLAVGAMRPPLVTVLCVASALFATGCIDREPFNPADVAAADAFHAREAAAASRASGPSALDVSCRCDADGNLHVHAPQAAVVRPAEGLEDAAAEISVPGRPRGEPIRRTVSLGFIGDGKLTETAPRGGPWNAPDALLPPHAHGVADRPHEYGGFVDLGRGFYVPAPLPGHVYPYPYSYDPDELR